ncbi:hypothetical protein ANCCAN_29095 [Ancylostoma caninum]|uniref:Uncharacterized protein n=1 Tax=Ancylostoma caninum TaxID=29170 RepID=A0A368EZF5_ANCCA|nr:hypothetical protein ANCCAN_29095 [Ancylostoma caninum]
MFLLHVSISICMSFRSCNIHGGFTNACEVVPIADSEHISGNSSGQYMNSGRSRMKCVCSPRTTLRIVSKLPAWWLKCISPCNA